MLPRAQPLRERQIAYTTSMQISYSLLYPPWSRPLPSEVELPTACVLTGGRIATLIRDLSCAHWGRILRNEQVRDNSLPGTSEMPSSREATRHPERHYLKRCRNYASVVTRWKICERIQRGAKTCTRVAVYFPPDSSVAGVVLQAPSVSAVVH